MNTNEEIQEKVDAMREELTKLRNSIEALMSSGMKEKTVLVLMHHYTKIPQKTIKQVIDGIYNLETEYFGEV